jgi:hypothetical protein
MAEFALLKYIECKVRWIEIQYLQNVLKCCKKFRQTQCIAKINLHVANVLAEVYEACGKEKLAASNLQIFRNLKTCR